MNILNPKSKVLHFNIIEKTKNPVECYEYLQDSIINFSKLNKNERLDFLEKLISYGLHHYNLESIMLEIKPIESDGSGETKACHHKGKITTQPYLFLNRADLSSDINSVFHELTHEHIDKNINQNRFKSISDPYAPSKIISFDPLIYDSQLNIPFWLKASLIGNLISPNSITEQYKFARYFLNENEMIARTEAMQFTKKIFYDCLEKLKNEPNSIKNHLLQKSILGDIALIEAKADNEEKYLQTYQELINKSQKYIKPSIEKFRKNALSSIKEGNIYPALTHCQILSSLQEGLDDESKDFFDTYYKKLIDNNKFVYAIDLLNHPLYPASKEQLIECLSQYTDTNFMAEKLTNYNPDDIELLLSEIELNRENDNSNFDDDNIM